jgi:hypothetical protein
MKALDYILQLKPAIPYSTEKPGTLASNSEIRRWITSGAIIINTERFTIDEEIDFPVFSLIFFPKSENRRTTLV